MTPCWWCAPPPTSPMAGTTPCVLFMCLHAPHMHARALPAPFVCVRAARAPTRAPSPPRPLALARGALAGARCHSRNGPAPACLQRVRAAPIQRRGREARVCARVARRRGQKGAPRRLSHPAHLVLDLRAWRRVPDRPARSERCAWVHGPCAQPAGQPLAHPRAHAAPALRAPMAAPPRRPAGGRARALLALPPPLLLAMARACVCVQGQSAWAQLRGAGRHWRAASRARTACCARWGRVRARTLAPACRRTTALSTARAFVRGAARFGVREVETVAAGSPISRPVASFGAKWQPNVAAAAAGQVTSSVPAQPLHCVHARRPSACRGPPQPPRACPAAWRQRPWRAPAQAGGEQSR